MRASIVIVPMFCLLASIPAVPVRACATAWPRGERVRIATESALIVWDEKSKTQHFIRRASFETKLPYFGFLVPTPTKPDLAEAPDDLFERLEDWTKAETKTRTVFREVSLGCAGSAMPKQAGQVEVLARQHVAGYNAVVLKADDAQALRVWLEEHNYDLRPGLTEWVEPYLKAGWIITAFQVTKTDKEDDRLSTQGVRMSFHTDKPFFPYREPADTSEGKRDRRLLRLFVLSGQRMRGELDDSGIHWPGKAVWANPLGGDQRQRLAALLDARPIHLPERAWLTVFDDDSSPRPGSTDLFFSPSPDQALLQREPIYEYRFIPMEWTCGYTCFVVLAGPVGLLMLSLSGRHRRNLAVWLVVLGAIGLACGGALAAHMSPSLARAQGNVPPEAGVLLLGGAVGGMLIGLAAGFLLWLAFRGAGHRA